MFPYFGLLKHFTCFKPSDFQEISRIHYFKLFFLGIPCDQLIFFDPRKESRNYQMFKIPKNVILYFEVDIGSILAKIHSCFLIDIGPVFKILKILFDGSSSFCGARLSQNWQKMKSRSDKHNIFLRMFPYIF